MRLIYHPEAEAEIIEAAEFYEGQIPTLGAQSIGHSIVNRFFGSRWRKFDIN
jgi:hypothetical protein